jgi:hypothetical protein
MQGLERGTIGFSAALELAVADALNEGDKGNAFQDAESLAEHRSGFLSAKKDGVRPLNEMEILVKLCAVGESYEKLPTSVPQKDSVDLYTELFTKVLFPPSRVTDSADPYSLQIQIKALFDVLRTPDVWFDFSLVEWRIRVGQILWANPYEPINDMVQDTSNLSDLGAASSQRSWLLLQLLLSSELLIRLDLVTKIAEGDPSIIHAAEVRQFGEYATQPVRWSLILARLWLENIRVEGAHENIAEESLPVSGWLATLTRNLTTTLDPVDQERSAYAQFRGRHQQRQINGLLHFAREIKWPLISENVASKLSLNATIFAESIANTPAVETPSTITTQASYFSSHTRSRSKHAVLQQQHGTTQPAGWLSRSYIAGLILPGESLSHFLISTLLENDEMAISQLGEEANLYGGFVYSSRSYWSTACIVGRVLAAGMGASECMGWISADIVPQDMEESWLEIAVETTLPHGV